MWDFFALFFHHPVQLPFLEFYQLQKCGASLIDTQKSVVAQPFLNNRKHFVWMEMEFWGTAVNFAIMNIFFFYSFWLVEKVKNFGLD